jgi:hypothetical protein
MEHLTVIKDNILLILIHLGFVYNQLMGAGKVSLSQTIRVS